MHRRRAPIVALVLGTLCLVLGSSALGLPVADAEATAAPPVPVPTLIGPVPDEVGTKGEPWFDPPFVLEEVEPFAYTSEEFLLEGTARDLIGDAGEAPYKTRMLVVRPVDAADFSGTVVVEWDNVTAQAALNPLWMWDHPYLLREGHAFVSVSAQQVGVSGPSPLAHTQWDPARYGDLSHPGDTWSFDIYAQAVEALVQDAPATDGTAGGTPQGLDDVLGDLAGELVPTTEIPAGGTAMGGLAVTNVIATGTSQSASRLHTYLNQIEGVAADNIDGFLLDAGGSRSYAKEPVDPTIHFLSEDGLSATTPNVGGESLIGSDTYRLWEVPAASHADAEFSRYIEDGLYLTHILEAPPLPWAQWDARRFGFRYGDDGLSLRAGCQPLGYGDNTYPRRYAARAAMDQLIRWTTSLDAADPTGPGKAKGLDKHADRGNGRAGSDPTFVPVQPERVRYDETGQPVRDANRQIVGGVRLPQIDVPVADYLATTCGLFGHTVGYDPATLQSLYPTTADYVARMEAAIEDALAAGTMLPEEAAELRVQLGTAVVPAYREPVAPGDGATTEGAAHLLAALVGG